MLVSYADRKQLQLCEAGPGAAPTDLEADEETKGTSWSLVADLKGSGFLSRQLLEARTERVQDGKEMKGMLLQLGHFAGHSGSKLLKICL